MKYLIHLTIFCLSVLNGFGQSETLIPQEAVSVVSINNISLLQKISLDDLVNYEFMESKKGSGENSVLESIPPEWAAAIEVIKRNTPYDLADQLTIDSKQGPAKRRKT